MDIPKHLGGNVYEFMQDGELIQASIKPDHIASFVAAHSKTEIKTVAATMGRGTKIHAAQLFSGENRGFILCNTNSNKNTIRYYSDMDIKQITCTKCMSIIASGTHTRN